MTWQHAVEWAEALSYHDSVRNVTWTNWRLPKIFDPEFGFSDCMIGPSSIYCSFGSNVIDPNTGELAHLFYATLGNVAQSGTDNTGPFINMFEGEYWYGDLFPPKSAWDFATINGSQGATALIGGVHYAWAVMDGDVGGIPPVVINVMIDIKPDDVGNLVNICAKKSLPVAILSSASFDAPAEVDPLTVSLADAGVKRFGKDGAKAKHRFRDVNGDGLTDMVVEIVTKDLALESGVMIATLTGQTFDGSLIEGRGAIEVEERMCVRTLE
jgi:hypothetical protein